MDIVRFQCESNGPLTGLFLLAEGRNHIGCFDKSEEQTIAGLGLALAGMATGLPMAYAGFLLGGLGVSVVGPLALGLVGQAVRSKYRLAAISQAAALGYAAFFLGPVIMGFVAEGFGLRVSFYVIAGIMFAVAALLLPSWGRMLGRQRVHIPSSG